MYLVKVGVLTPGGILITGEKLHEVLSRSAADTDQLQHAHLAVDRDSVTFSLYIVARGEQDAACLAEQLCRRTMAVVAPGGSWSVMVPHMGP